VQVEKEAKKEAKAAYKAKKDEERAMCYQMKMENKKREEEEKARKKAEKAEKMPWLPAVEARLALMKAPVEANAVDTFKCKEYDVMQWVWKGETYLRDWRNYVWRQEDGEMGDFLGMYIFAKDVIEEAEEPLDDSEE
jgi:hypothetical protein